MLNINLERIGFLCKRKSILNAVRIQVFKRPLTTVEDELSMSSVPHIAQDFIQEGYRESKRPQRTIKSLHPAKMVSMGQSTYDISEATRLRFSFRDENHPVRVFLHTIQGRPSFPNNTRGVLYYHTDPSLPSIAGEVRFRLCDTIENFERGSDLHIRGEPWSLMLAHIAFTPNFIGLRKLLVKEGLVDTQMMSDISKLPNLDKLDNRLVLFHLSQPFYVDLASHTLVLTLLTRTSVQKIKLPYIFVDRRLGRTLPLYTGKPINI